MNNDEVIDKARERREKLSNEMCATIISYIKNNRIQGFLILAKTYNDLANQLKLDVCKSIAKELQFDTPKRVELEIQAWQIFITIKDLSKERVVDLICPHTFVESCIDGPDCDLPETIVHIIGVLSIKLYYKYDRKNEDFINRRGLYDEIIEILSAGHNKDKKFLREKSASLAYIDIEIYKKENDKKLSTILKKAEKKYKAILHMKNAEEILDNLQSLESRTINKIYKVISFEETNDYPMIKPLFNDIKIAISKTKEKIKQQHDKQLKEREIIATAKISHDIRLIEQVFSRYHQYFKKTQIQKEVDASPIILEYYRRFHSAEDTINEEDKILLLEELQTDIKRNQHKKLESGRRLWSIAQSIITELTENSEEDYKEAPVVIEKQTLPIHKEPAIPTHKIAAKEHESRPITKFGDFLVYTDIVKYETQSIDVLLRQIHIKSPQDSDHLADIVYKTGYDKVYDYLMKQPSVTIQDLDNIIKTDKKLRYLYLRNLEEIENYFKSTFTHFISNKYDKTFEIVGSVPPRMYYHRGYLMKSLFEDKELHYHSIQQLNTRIDYEYTHKNMKIIKEVRAAQKSINFSTAVGIMSFGWCIHMFDNLNEEDKGDYLKCYFKSLSSHTFVSWLVALNRLRNKIAHYETLYRITTLKELPPVMTMAEDKTEHDYQQTASLFYYTIVLARLSPDPTMIEDFVDEAAIVFRQAERKISTFNLSTDYNFPVDWRTILENEKGTYIGHKH